MKKTGKAAASGARSGAKSGLRSRLDAELHDVEAEISRYKRDLEIPPEEIAPVPVVSAAKLEKKVEEEAGVFRKSAMFSGGRLTGKGHMFFYFISSLICVAVLAFLFGSWDSFVFYLAFGMFLWWWSHQFHLSRSGVLKPFISLGALVILLYISHWFFNGLLGILMTVLYALSFVIAGVLYFYHFKRELSEEIHRSFPHTFLVMFYTHVIAFTVASVVAFLMPKIILSDSFVSVTYLILTWLLPSLIVYFFLTKFLYISFFDRGHAGRDVKKGLAHAAIYSAVFIVLMVLAYLLTAMQFAVVERSGYDDAFSGVFTQLQNVKPEIDKVQFDYGDVELVTFPVSQELIGMADELNRNATALKAHLDRSSLSAGDYLSDNYFTVLAQDRLSLAGVSLAAEEVNDVKSSLVREYGRLRRFEAEGRFDDGTSGIEQHASALSAYVSAAMSLYSEPYDVRLVKERLVSSHDSYSGLLGDGELIGLAVASDPGLAVLLPGISRFSRSFYDVLYHTVVFRDLVLLVSETAVLQVDEFLMPSVVKGLYLSAPDEPLKSRVIRHRIVKSDIDATLASSPGPYADLLEV
ncbi:hypothetical protein JW898_01545 [Candidatus Woesearchaeota archaeon]|nr:hypothetical protein [Candidatus Woesearchaeota archaeon]